MNLLQAATDSTARPEQPEAYRDDPERTPDMGVINASAAISQGVKHEEPRQHPWMLAGFFIALPAMAGQLRPRLNAGSFSGIRPATRPAQPSYSGTKFQARDWLAMQWIEALINVSAFVGFVGIATHWPTESQDR